MPKPRIDYDAVQRYVLVLMYEAFVGDAAMAFDIPRVRKALAVPKNLIEVTFDALEEDDLIHEVEPGNKYARILPKYELTADGRRHVAEMPDELYDAALVALASGAAVSAFQTGPTPQVGPAPDAWQPLPIEQGGAELENVRSALADVVQKVEQDNGYAAEHADERAEVLSGLTGARTLLSHASQISYSAFVAYVVWPLDTLLKRFPTNTVVGAAGKLLWEAVREWAKSRTGTVLDDIFKLGK